MWNGISYRENGTVYNRRLAIMRFIMRFIMHESDAILFVLEKL